MREETPSIDFKEARCVNMAHRASLFCSPLTKSGNNKRLDSSSATEI